MNHGNLHRPGELYISRRTFLRTSAAALGTTLLGTARGWTDPAAVTRISILHTTDLHGNILPTVSYDGVADLGGLARCATQLRRWREESPHFITVDVGDVYQGTAVGLDTHGKVMIRCFNSLQYDGWVIGNHEFDWGVDPLVDAVAKSEMPILTANLQIMGKNPGELDDLANPLSRIKPYLLKEIAGYKIAIVGLTTPGLPYWFRPDFYKGFEPMNPVTAAGAAIDAAKRAGADAIILAVHMGLRGKEDDFANQTRRLISAYPEVVAVLAGHTHKLIPGEERDGVLLTQANYYGIHAGRVTLTFDNNTRKLISRTAETKLMDSSIPLDPVVLALAKDDLEHADEVLRTPVVKVVTDFEVKTGHGRPSDVEILIAAAIRRALSKRGVQIDGVIHGLFQDAEKLSAGEKTIEDSWKIVPFENYIVTASLTLQQLQIALNEVYQRGPRNLMGMHVTVEGSGKETKVKEITDLSGRPVDPAKRYLIALNTFDSRSGGQRFMQLRQILEEPEAQTTMHPVQTREALLELFNELKEISPDKVRAIWG